MSEEDIITVLLLRVKELLQETNKMREALESIAELADTYVVCDPGQCRDCDLLADIGKTATAALEEVNDE